MQGRKNSLKESAWPNFGRKGSAFLLLLLTLILSHSGVLGSTVSYREAGIEMEVPEGLILEIDNCFLTVVDTDRTMTLRIILSSLQVIEQFYGPLQEELSNYVDQPEVSEEHPEIRVNDTLQYYAEGVGLHEDEIVDWHLAFIAGGRRSLLIVGLGDISPHMDKIKEFYHSFRLLELPIPPEPEETEDEGNKAPDTGVTVPGTV